MYNLFPKRHFVTATLLRVKETWLFRCLS